MKRVHLAWWTFGVGLVGVEMGVVIGELFGHSAIIAPVCLALGFALMYLFPPESP